jgi:hypothetical protein
MVKTYQVNFATHIRDSLFMRLLRAGPLWDSPAAIWPVGRPKCRHSPPLSRGNGNRAETRRKSHEIVSLLSMEIRLLFARRCFVSYTSELRQEQI